MTEIAIDPKKLQGKGVCFLIPLHHHDIDFNCTRAIYKEMDLLNKFGVETNLIFFAGDSLIQRVRSRMATFYHLDTSLSHSMWVDGDIGFQEGAVLTMLAAEQPLIGGSYPLKRLEVSRLKSAIDAGVDEKHLLKYATSSVVQLLEEHKGSEINMLEPFKVQRLGTGFMLVAREVFDAFVKAEPDAWFTANQGHGEEKIYEFFKCPREGNTLQSEDYYFCAQAQRLGFPSFLAPWVQLTHTGPFVYEGDFFRSHGVVYDHEKKKEGESK